MNHAALHQALQAINDGILSIDVEGRIWRHFRSPSRNHWRPFDRVPVATRRAESLAGRGYLRLTLGIPGQQRTHSVMAHTVVWVWTYGAIAEGKQINHRNGDKQDNALANLELVTASENMKHSWRVLGRTPVLVTPKRRPDLDDAARKRMLTLREAGLSFSAIAQQFACSPAYVHGVVKGGG